MRRATSGRAKGEVPSGTRCIATQYDLLFGGVIPEFESCPSEISAIAQPLEEANQRFDLAVLINPE